MLTIPDVDKLKWNLCEDDILNQKVYWLEGFRSLTNINQHAIMLFAERKTNHYTNPNYQSSKPASWTQYTIEINYGPYGESGESVELRPKIKLADAKAEVIKRVKLLIAAGIEFKS